ncbi:unnamed protein product, partial [Rotaria magnacalcarata]
SLPDLTEKIPNSDNAYNNSEHSNDIEPSSSTSSISTNPLISPSSPTKLDIKTKSTAKTKLKRLINITCILYIERPQSAGGNQSTPKSQRKT